MKMIAMLWDDYRRKVIAPQANPNQVNAMRDAFYAGAATTFNTILSSLSESDEVKPEDEQLLINFEQELTDFLQERAALAAAMAMARGRKPS